MFLKKLWYGLVLGGDPALYNLEVDLLKTLYHAMPEQDKPLFNQQLNRLDLVQRSPDNKVVALYQAKDSYFSTWDDILISNKAENFKIFQASASGTQCPKSRLVAMVFFHQGRISSIEYKSKIDWPDNFVKSDLSDIDWDKHPGGERVVFTAPELFY